MAAAPEGRSIRRGLTHAELIVCRSVVTSVMVRSSTAMYDVTVTVGLVKKLVETPVLVTVDVPPGGKTVVYELTSR